LKASNTDQQDRFGSATMLSSDGSTLAVGAREEDSSSSGVNGDQNDNSIASTGAIYIFSHVDGNWQQEAYLKASNPRSLDGFGTSLSLGSDGNTLAVGVPAADGAAIGVNGDQNDQSAFGAGAGPK